ncbi:MAG TPA: replicative DNA helicase [Spirochaetota bacterium]|nr:replicative DNA helicase [Spirochaetota bacterium]HOD14980.1 replicative DNA helicase [Spirochaetota bacterium]HPG50920.1 replicative DNA helicase [Spirochaetota bacterium]HPN14322.1 replicative DNA helicase [Spirochaetota bacterium]
MLAEKLPPQDIETEIACLASVLLSREALYRVIEILQPEDFYLDKHRIIYGAILELLQKDLPVDLTTVKQRLVDHSKFEKIGGDPALVELYQAVSTSANAEFYARRIQELSLRRRLIEVSTESVERCYDMSLGTDELLDEVERQIFDVTERRISSDFKPIEAVLHETMNNIGQWYETKRVVTGVGSGFKKLDEMLTGFHAAELIIIAARPGMGKTALALNIVNHIALKEKKAVLFFSLEMPATQLGMRMLCIDSKIDSQLVRTGYIKSEEMHKLIETSGRLSRSSIFIDDSPSSTVLQMRAKARRLYQKNKELGVIVVDYLQLITGTNPRIDRHLQIAEISRFLKQLARDLEVPVIALSQLSRQVEHRTDQRPTLADLRESGAIEQDADVVMFIYREDKVKKETERRGVADVIIAKQRNGPVGEVPLKFWEKYTRFDDLEEVHAYEEMGPDYEIQ